MCLYKCMKNKTYKTACANGLPDDGHKIFETCRRQEELNKNSNLKSTFCWLTLHKCTTTHGTTNIKFLDLSRPGSVDQVHSVHILSS